MSIYLDPKSDVVFKKIFGKHPKLLKSFLNALLPLPSDAVIESIDYLNPENIPDLPPLKRTIVDVRCTDQQGRQFIVEMQVEWVPAFIQRVLFNTSAVYTKQLYRGENYASLNHVYGLALLAHNFRPDDPHWLHHYKMTHQKSQESLDDIQLVFVELPKFKPKTAQAKRLAVLWLRFMLEIDEKTRTVDPDLLTIPEIKEAIALSKESAYTPSELEAYERYWDSVSAETTLLDGKFKMGLANGRIKGLAEGLAEGRVKGMSEAQISIARSLFDTGMSLELIAKHTKLSYDELKKLLL